MKKSIILQELKGLLLTAMGKDIDRVILYGSQVYGKATRFSDYDILIVIKKKCDWRLENEIIKLCYELDLKYGIITDVKIISQKELLSIKGKQPFILEAFNKGMVA